MRSFLTFCLIALAPLPALAQRKKGVEPVKIVELNRKEPIVYQKDIEPIFYKRCVACHSGSIKEGNFDVSSYETVIKGGKRGTPVVPGKSKKSHLYQMLTRVDRPFMPPRSEDPVTPEELALVKLWIDQGAKAPTGASIVKARVLIDVLPEKVTPVRAVAVSPDKSTVAAGRGNQIQVYDANSGTFIRNLLAPGLVTHDMRPIKGAHTSVVESMAFSPDGKYLVSGSFREVHIWDVQTGTLRQRLTGFAHNVVDIAFTYDGKLFATAGGAPTEDGEIKFYEVGSWKLLGEVKNGHSDTVYGICFSKDGKTIVSGSADKFVKTFEVPSGKFIKPFEGHSHHVLGVGWMYDSKYIVSASADETIKIWDYEKGEQVRTYNNLHDKQITRLMFVGKTSRFLTSSGSNRVRAHNLNKSNGSVGNSTSFSGHKDFIYAIGVSPDGQVVATGGQEGVVRVYNGGNGQLTHTLLPPSVKTSATAKK